MKKLLISLVVGVLFLSLFVQALSLQPRTRESRYYGLSGSEGLSGTFATESLASYGIDPQVITHIKENANKFVIINAKQGFRQLGINEIKTLSDTELMVLLESPHNRNAVMSAANNLFGDSYVGLQKRRLGLTSATTTHANTIRQLGFARARPVKDGLINSVALEPLMADKELASIVQNCRGHTFFNGRHNEDIDFYIDRNEEELKYILK